MLHHLRYPLLLAICFSITVPSAVYAQYDVDAWRRPDRYRDEWYDPADLLDEDDEDFEYEYRDDDFDEDVYDRDDGYRGVDEWDDEPRRAYRTGFGWTAVPEDRAADYYDDPAGRDDLYYSTPDDTLYASDEFVDDHVRPAYRPGTPYYDFDLGDIDDDPYDTPGYDYMDFDDDEFGDYDSYHAEDYYTNDWYSDDWYADPGVFDEWYR